MTEAIKVDDETHEMYNLCISRGLQIVDFEASILHVLRLHKARQCNRFSLPNKKEPL